MITVAFTKESTKELRALSNNHPHFFVRKKALVLLLKSQNLTIAIISKIVDACENTIRSYFKVYNQEGIDAIKAIDFRKPGSSLTTFEGVIKKYFDETPPATVKQACDEIEKLTKISIKETQMRKFLKGLGIKYRKVAGIPAKADPQAQKEFLEEKLQPRLNEALDDKRTVYFIDAAHFVLGAYLGYLWSATRVFVPTPSGRQRFNVLGAVNATTKELLMITNTTYITSIQVCELLDLMAQKAMDPKTKVFHPVTVVLDNAGYQRCALVIEKAQLLGIELLFLPTYSPNLNLIERLWKFTKKKCLNSKYYSNFNLFKTVINDFLENAHSAHQEELKSLLTLRFQTFSTQQQE